VLNCELLPSPKNASLNLSSSEEEEKKSNGSSDKDSQKENISINI
jgi:hypothetical protein